MTYDPDRFHDGEHWSFAGVDFRIVPGDKPTHIVGATDHVLEWCGVNGWQPVVCDGLFLALDLIAWNEDALNPYPRRGGEELLRYLRVARVEGWRRATALLHEARARANDPQAYT